MKKVYACENAALIGHLRDVLAERGIACVVRNWYLTGDTGGSSPLEWPELWVVHAEDEAAARTNIDAWLSSDTQHGEPWRCSECGASVPGNFACCWRCERERDRAGS